MNKKTNSVQATMAFECTVCTSTIATIGAPICPCGYLLAGCPILGQNWPTSQCRFSATRRTWEASRYVPWASWVGASIAVLRWCWRSPSWPSRAGECTGYFALQVCPILGQVFGPASGVNLDSWCQTRGFQVGILVRYGLGGLILVLVAFQQPVEPT